MCAASKRWEVVDGFVFEARVQTIWLPKCQMLGIDDMHCKIAVGVSIQALSSVPRLENLQWNICLLENRTTWVVVNFERNRHGDA